MRVSVASIVEVVGSYYEVTALDLRAHRREVKVLLPRFVAIWLCRRHTSASLPEIGRQFGGRNHSTILNAVRRIDAMRVTDSQLVADILEIEALLAGIIRAVDAVTVEGWLDADLDPEEIAWRAVASRHLATTISLDETTTLARAYLDLLEIQGRAASADRLKPEFLSVIEDVRHAFAAYRVAQSTPTEGAAMIALTAAMRPLFFADELVGRRLRPGERTATQTLQHKEG